MKCEGKNCGVMHSEENPVDTVTLSMNNMGMIMSFRVCLQCRANIRTAINGLLVRRFHG